MKVWSAAAADEHAQERMLILERGANRVAAGITCDGEEMQATP